MIYWFRLLFEFSHAVDMFFMFAKEKKNHVFPHILYIELSFSKIFKCTE